MYVPLALHLLLPHVLTRCSYFRVKRHPSGRICGKDLHASMGKGVWWAVFPALCRRFLGDWCDDESPGTGYV
ncbi:hypothetical protein B0H14DRAFT_2717057, partial [Mycena olivaceomarginata]